MRKTAQLAAIALVFGFIGFACVSIASAQSAPPDPADDPAGFIRFAYEAATAKRWSVVAGVAIIGATFAVRRWLLGRVAWFQTRVGGVAIALALSLSATFGLALANGSDVTAALLLDALSTALTAAGGWAWLQHALKKKPTDGGGN